MNSNGKRRKNKDLEVEFPTENRFPDYVQESKRLESFRSWPAFGIINPRQMVESGFFYIGRRDLAVCFSCGGNFQEFKAGDEPWKLHESYYKQRCGFLKYLKYMKKKNKPPTKPRKPRDETRRRQAKDEGKTCKICLNFEYNTLLMPCNHVVVCSKCVEKIQECPYCRAKISEIKRIFLT
jgi:Inhibitor of Apoptosis domain/Zinc finger, C3HC4 type (RING finger)